MCSTVQHLSSQMQQEFCRRKEQQTQRLHDDGTKDVRQDGRRFKEWTTRMKRMPDRWCRKILLWWKRKLRICKWEVEYRVQWGQHQCWFSFREGRVADNYTRSSFRGITLDEVMRSSWTLRKMVTEFHQYIDWNQTRTEQGNWPTLTRMKQIWQRRLDCSKVVFW